MKVNGEKLYVPFKKWIVIPRAESDEHIGFLAKSVDCRDEFNRLCPRPEPPMITKRGGSQEPDLKDEEYLEKITEHSKKFFDFLVLCSIELPEGWEWETVDLLDPDTFKNWREEFHEAGFSETELIHITNEVLNVNNLNDEAVKAAEKDFLALLRQQDKNPSDQDTEQTST